MGIQFSVIASLHGARLDTLLKDRRVLRLSYEDDVQNARWYKVRTHDPLQFG